MIVRYMIILLALIYGSDLVADIDLEDQQSPKNKTDKIVFIQDDIDHDIYLAGSQITVKANVDGDVVAVGRRVTIEEKISEDVIATAKNITIDGDIGDDARLAGGQVIVNGNITEDAIIAGGLIQFSSHSTVGNRAWLVGGSIEFNGRAGDELIIKGREIIIAGEIAGDVTLYAKNIQILPTAKIMGNFTYTSAEEANIHPGSVISGSVRKQPLPDWQSSSLETLKELSITISILFLLSIVISVGILYLLLPDMFMTASDTVSLRFLQCIAVGLMIFLITPPLIILLFITILGAPLALLVLLFYIALLIMGYFIAIFYVGDRLLTYIRRNREKTTLWRLLSIVVALMVLLILSAIPLIGLLTLFFIFLVGLGSTTFYLLSKLGMSKAVNASI
ncbi:hypothetical protein AB835_01410 [Candidatus Endobugula sertula]|uniref:DUF8173 domain-containing protein n=1 Tax=Candidatus Endobugula sertula TaxID=62101 RepID=A0A1D2QTP0_9GAMM|nr:hypothetical protein AB835_01410 [Candidatus Endobugula sertula]